MRATVITTGSTAVGASLRRSWFVHTLGAALTVASLLLWWATGAEGYTRWPDEKLAAADRAPAAGEDELLEAIGFGDGPSMRPEIESRFAFGLVPGGIDPPHLLAVATVAAAALLVSTGVVIAQVGRRVFGIENAWRLH